MTGRPVHACTLKKRKKEPRSLLEAAVRPKKSVVCGQKASSKNSATCRTQCRRAKRWVVVLRVAVRRVRVAGMVAAAAAVVVQGRRAVLW
jgi:cob(I)alamin adenosyltransferase